MKSLCRVHTNRGVDLYTSTSVVRFHLRDRYTMARPSATRYPAPAILTTKNASDERMTTAASPNPAKVAWHTIPHAVPAATNAPPRRPRASTRLVTSVKLVPGVKQIGSTASANPRTNGHPRGIVTTTAYRPITSWLAHSHLGVR